MGRSKWEERAAMGQRGQWSGLVLGVGDSDEGRSLEGDDGQATSTFEGLHRLIRRRRMMKDVGMRVG